MYLHAKNYQNLPSDLKVEFHKPIMDGHASAWLIIKKSGICQLYRLGLINTHLHNKKKKKKKKKKIAKYCKRFKNYNDFHKLITDGHVD